MTVCEECGGTGEYRGLNVVEPCQACSVLRDKNGDVCRNSSGEPFTVAKIKNGLPEGSLLKQNLQTAISPLGDTVVFGLTVGDTIDVEIQCDDPNKALNSVTKVISRPIFGYPPNTFLVTSVQWCETKGIRGQLRMGHNGQAHMQAVVDENAEVHEWQVRELSACDDMTFFPVDNTNA